MLGFGSSGPVRGRAESELACAQAKVFEFVGFGFFENYEKWCPQVVELEPLTETPIRKGMRGRQVTLDRGIRSESTFEVVAFAPCERLEIGGLSERFRSSYEFEATEAGKTRIAFTFELEEIDLVMRPFQKLIKAALQEGAAQTVENIGALLEDGEGPAKSAPSMPENSLAERL